MQLKIEHSIAFCISIYTPIGKLTDEFDELVLIAGGCTKTVGHGVWINGEGDEDNEPVCITQILLTDNGKDNNDAMQALFHGAYLYMQANPKEEALLILVDDKKVLITREDEGAVSEPA